MTRDAERRRDPPRGRGVRIRRARALRRRLAGPLGRVEGLAAIAGLLLVAATQDGAVALGALLLCGLALWRLGGRQGPASRAVPVARQGGPEGQAGPAGQAGEGPPPPPARAGGGGRIGASDGIAREELEAALRGGEFRPWFQPQVAVVPPMQDDPAAGDEAAATGPVTGVELLARWHHPRHGVLTPDRFLGDLARAGLLDALGQAMLRGGMSALAGWDRAGLRVPRVALNLSAQELGDPGLAARLLEMLDARGLAPGRLAIEVLESVAPMPTDEIGRPRDGVAAPAAPQGRVLPFPPQGGGRDATSRANEMRAAPEVDPTTAPAMTIEGRVLPMPDPAYRAIEGNIRALREAGLRIELDDFGTGAASIAQAVRLGVHRIKIDRSFVAGIERDAHRLRAVAAIVDLAARLDVETLAEGVESPDQARALAEIGCGHLQGYAVARPMPLDMATDWLIARRRPAAGVRSCRARLDRDPIPRPPPRPPAGPAPRGLGL
jgi:EAL domain-containing protein (putative c-di-GMP-specific phosphodiesterase class I)